jgi:hypothetical protein
VSGGLTSHDDPKTLLTAYLAPPETGPEGSPDRASYSSAPLQGQTPWMAVRTREGGPQVLQGGGGSGGRLTKETPTVFHRSLRPQEDFSLRGWAPCLSHRPPPPRSALPLTHKREWVSMDHKGPLTCTHPPDPVSLSSLARHSGTRRPRIMQGGQSPALACSVLPLLLTSSEGPGGWHITRVRKGKRGRVSRLASIGLVLLEPGSDLTSPSYHKPDVLKATRPRVGAAEDALE